MVKLSKDAELSLEELLLHCIHPLFLNDLDCPDLLPKPSLAFANFAQGTLPQELSKLVAVLELGLVDTDEVRLLDDELVFVMNLLLLLFFLLLYRGNTVAHFCTAII